MKNLLNKTEECRCCFDKAGEINNFMGDCYTCKAIILDFTGQIPLEVADKKLSRAKVRAYLTNLEIRPLRGNDATSRVLSQEALRAWQ